MEYLIGVILALAISFFFGTVVGLDRRHAFYPVVMIVIASYYASRSALSQQPAKTGGRNFDAATGRENSEHDAFNI